MSFNELFSKLNEEQQEAVLDIHGPSMVVAGPGAGKTSVLVARTANMIKNGISPSNILLFTFTKKAANEIRERINNVIGEEANSITIGTYHSLCSRILRQYCTTIGLNKRYTIDNSEDLEPFVYSPSSPNNNYIQTIVIWKVYTFLYHYFLLF